MVQVFAPADANGRGYVRAGYLVVGGLVLTARHVIEGAIAPCEVRTLRGSTWVATTVLWAGEEDGDVALLRVKGRWAMSSACAWGALWALTAWLVRRPGFRGRSFGAATTPCP
jgi:hypothetical protein